MGDEARPGRSRLEVTLDLVTDLSSWVWLALIAVIVVAVVLRFVFSLGRIELEELQWHLYAVGFLMGIVACTGFDRHVRVDVFRERMSARLRDWIDFYGILLLQLPFLALVLWSALPFVVDSFVAGERSASAGGLPFRWILKSMLPISFVLLALATLSRLVRVGRRLFGDGDPGGGR